MDRNQLRVWLFKTLAELSDNPELIGRAQSIRTLDELGINSIVYIRLIVCIEQQFGVEFTTDEDMVMNNYNVIDVLLDRILQGQPI